MWLVYSLQRIITAFKKLGIYSEVTETNKIFEQATDVQFREKNWLERTEVMNCCTDLTCCVEPGSANIEERNFLKKVRR